MTETPGKYGSELERTLEMQMKVMNIPPPQKEYQFCKSRRWRFDFAWPLLMIAVECEGGTWSRGRHTRGSGFEKDCEKYNAAALRGWRVFRYTSRMINDGSALQQLTSVLDWNEDGLP